MALSYLLGSIPTSIIISRLLKGIDIREHGSMNAGATNVFRVLGPVPGVIVLLLDALKGVVAVVFLTKLSLGSPAAIDPIYFKLMAAVASILGHVYSVFAGFRGGKGIGTGAGALLGLIPREVGLAFVVFLVVVILTRYVSLGSLCAAMFLGILLPFERAALKIDQPLILVFVCWGLVFLTFYTHRDNVRRLVTGTERRIGEKVKV